MTAWLPSETIQKRRTLQRALLRQSAPRPRTRLAEFLTEKNILLFFGPAGKAAAAEALVATLIGVDRRAAWRDLWARERRAPLRIEPDTAILRARVPSLHHLQAALGICPDGFALAADGRMTRLLVVLAGPSDQSPLHMNLLASVSCALRDRSLARRLLRAGSAAAALRALRQAEGLCEHKNPLRQARVAMREFLARRFRWE